MYGWMDWWMDVWMYGCMDVWMYGCMDAWMHGCMDARMYGWMYGCTDVWIYWCLDVWMYVCVCMCMCVWYIYIHIYTYAQPPSQNPPLQLPFCDTLNCSQWSKYHTWCASHYGKCFLCKKWVGLRGVALDALLSCLVSGPKRVYGVYDVHGAYGLHTKNALSSSCGLQVGSAGLCRIGIAWHDNF